MLTNTPVYGLNINKCVGTSILDGLSYIRERHNNTILEDLTLSKCSRFSNSYCVHCIMNINGRNLRACDTSIKNLMTFTK